MDKVGFSPEDRKVIRHIKSVADRNNGVSLKNISKNTELNLVKIEKSIDNLSRIYSLDLKDEKVYLANSHIDRAFPLEFSEELRYLNSKTYYEESVDSTNSILKKLAVDNNIDTGTIIVAEHQTKGRGQTGKSWFDLEFASIIMSCFLKLDINIDMVQIIPITVGLALAETINKHCAVESEIKWPNDILINNRKVAGVLLEGSIMQNKLEYAIIGIGINVNYQENQFPSDLKNKSTSLRIETNRINNRLNILNELIENLDQYIYTLMNGENQLIANRANKLLHHRGNVVLYKGDKYIIDSINPSGKLLLTGLNDGNRIEINSSGDIEYAYGY
jgi:BirA family transcriptional regulator, biotin operon repressor / biotin---[acetyl-CoA-carboxylase] ligase